MQAQIEAERAMKPVTLKIVTALFFILGFLFCGQVVIPHFLAHRHFMDLIMDPLLLGSWVYMGYGLLKFKNYARLWAMSFFVMAVMFCGLCACERASGGMGALEVFQITIARNTAADIETLICLASGWSFFILARPSIRKMFLPKNDFGGR